MQTPRIVDQSLEPQDFLPLLRCGKELFDNLKVNQPVYFTHPQRLYARGEFVSVNKTTAKVKTDAGQNVEIPLSDVFIGTEISVDGIEDMINIQTLNEPVIMANLEQRFNRQKIYTFVGSILISVNPFKKIPIYTPSILRMYNGQTLGTLPPHIYAIADAAYQSARREHRRQAILISGESGAGKTEAVKIIIRYLTNVSTKSQTSLMSRRSSTVTPQDRIISSNPILEAFGNAKTIRNNNSSRFAKLVNIQLDDTGYIVGGHIKQFLLEKSRVVSQTKNERNFHIFYYLLGGVDKSERAVWSLTEPRDYKYTASLRDTSIVEENLKHNYTALKRAMTTGGISVHEQHLILTLMSAILHLGNTRFKEIDDEVHVKNMEVIKWTAHLLKCDAQLLAEALTFDEAVIADELVELPLSMQKANDARDTLAMELYRRNFDWIVDHLNQDMKSNENDTDIALLDIFGFEQYEINRFEQFMINYANERVQHEFNEQIFRLEVELYKREKIRVPKFQYSDNMDVLEQIENDPNGVLMLLDRECRLKSGSDKTLITKLRRQLPSQPRTSSTTFTIVHYAGECTYDIRGFIASNRGYFSKRMSRALRSSRIPQFASLFSKNRQDSEFNSANATLARSYVEDLKNLMDLLGNSTLQYIRCIKPNARQSNNEFDRIEVLCQLRTTGLLNTISIRKDGYPYRWSHEEHLIRYEMLLSPTVSLRKHRKLKKKIIILMDDLGIAEGQYQIGSTKVFLKDSIFHDLEGRRTVYFDDAATIIQARVRCYQQRKKYIKKYKSTKLLQFWFRRYLEAVDVSEELGDVFKQISSNDSNLRAKAVGRINQMAGRQANVDKIVDRGGINTIMNVFNDGDDATIAAGAKALKNMSRKREHSQQIARGGGVKSMVGLIKSRDTTKGVESIELLGHLSRDENNVGLVVREGGLDALSKALQRHTQTDRISDINASAPALALANVTQSKRAAKVLGRDREMIKAIIDGIRKKPTYGRLAEHSCNTLANLAERPENVDQIVELGGLDAIILVMKHHRHNELVMKELARLCELIAANPQYAKLLGKMGALELALASLREAPERCGESALRILLALYGHPENAKRMIKLKAIQTFLEILATANEEDLVTWAIKMIKQMVMNRLYCRLIHQEDGDRIISDSLTRCRKFVEHNIYAIEALEIMAKNEHEILELLKSSDIVSIIAHSMERHYKSELLEKAGKMALRLFSTKNDLIKAMDVVGQSRMKSQTEQVLMQTGHALVNVAALAILEENVDFIIDEDGIPILLSIVNGIAANVKKKIANRVLAPAIRALSRLLIDDNTVDAFVVEGGIQSLVGTINEQCDKERVCDVCVTCSTKLMLSAVGYNEAIKENLIAALLNILKENYQWVDAMIALLKLFISICESKANGTKILRDNNTINALSIMMPNHIKNANVMEYSISLLIILTILDEMDTNEYQLCTDLILKAMLLNPEHEGLAIKSLQFLTKFCDTEVNKQRLRDKRAITAVLLILDHHYGNIEITTMATQIITAITTIQEIMDAIKELLRLSAELEKTPNDKSIMSQASVPVTLIGCMASSFKAAKAMIVKSDGLLALHNCLLACLKSNHCGEHERLVKHLAVASGRLVAHRELSQTIIDGSLIDALLTVIKKNIDYENVVEEVQSALEVLSRNPLSIQYLIDIDSVPVIVDMVDAHPLNDNILISGTRYVVRLAKGADIRSLPHVRKDGIKLAMIGIHRFMKTEDHLIDALSNVHRLALLTHDDSHVVIGSDKMKIFLQVFKKHENSPSVMIATMQACCALAADKGFVAHFVSLGMLNFIVEGLDRYCDNEEFCAVALELISKLPSVKVNLRKLVSIKAHILVMETMARHIDSEKVSEKGVLALRWLVTYDPSMAMACTKNGGVRMSFNAIRHHPLSAAIVYNGMCFALHLAKHKELHKVLLAERTKDMVSWTLRAYPKNSKLRDVCEKILDLLLVDQNQKAELIKGAKKSTGKKENVPSIANLEQQEHQQLLKSLLKVMKIIKDPKSTRSQLISAFQILIDSKAPLNVLNELIKQGGLAQLVYILDEKSDDSEIVLGALKSLALFTHSNHISVIVAYGGIGALIKAMKKNINKPSVLDIGTKLIGKYSVYNRLKVLIGLHDGISVILTIMERYLTLPALLNRCAFCLGNLAANCLPNRRVIIKHGGVNLISFSMQKHRSYLELVINTARALSPLCSDNVEARNELSKDGGSLVLIRTIQINPANTLLLQNGLQCLHKISQTNTTLSQLIHQGAVQAVVAAMRQFRENEKVQQFAVEILANLAAHQSRETFPQLTKDGAVEMVISIAVHHHKNMKIQTATFSTLESLCITQPKLSTVIVKSGFVAKILESLARKSVTEQCLIKGLDLLTILSDNEINAQTVVASGAAHIITVVMRYHATKIKVVQRTLITLSKLSTTKANAKALANNGVVQASIEALLGRADNSRFLIDVLRVLVNLAILERNAISISETAVDPLIKCVENHFASHPFLRMFYLLLSNLTMWPKATRHLIEHGMIPIILSTIKATANYPTLVARMIHVLSNMCGGGELAKRMLTNDGALQLVKQMMIKHSNHTKLMKQAEKFLENLGGRNRRGSQIDFQLDLSTFVEQYVPENDRNLLRAGQSFLVYAEKSKPQTYHLKVTLDFRTLTWSGVKNSDSQGELPVRFLKEARPGACTKELRKKKFNQRKADPECSFALFDSRKDDWALSLEASDKVDATAFVHALQNLKDAYMNFSVGI